MLERRPPRLFRALLWLYPARVRRLDGDDMWHTFASRLDEARSHGRGTRALLWAREIGAALGSGLVGQLRRPPLVPRWETLSHDVRSGVRSLRRTPVATSAAVMTLALGIGANVAVFSLMYSVLWRPPQQVRDPQQLVRMEGRFRGQTIPLSYAAYLLHRNQSTTFESLVGYWEFPVHLHDGGAAGRLRGMLVTDNYFAGLGVRLTRGRWLSPVEGADPRGYAFAVISHRLWQRQFGGHEYVVNHIVRLNGRHFRIIGVAPEGFGGLRADAQTDIWVPMAQRDELLATGPTAPGAFIVRVVGRLAPTIDQDTAAAQVAAVVIPRRIGHLAYDSATLHYPAWVPLDVGGRVRPIAVLMLVMVLVLLAIACANLAGLLLVRAKSRAHELTVRAALGASRGHLFRHILIEGVLLTGTGTLVGLTVARLASEALRGYELAPGIHAGGLDVTIDGNILAFAMAVAVVSGLSFTIAPALVASRPRNELILGVVGGREPFGRLGSALAIAQLGASVTLLIAASALLGAINNLSRVDLGFDPAGVLRASVDLELDDVAGDDMPQSFLRGIVSRGFVTREISGSAAADRAPASFPARGRGTVFVHATRATSSSAPREGARYQDGGVTAQVTSVTPRYHWTLQIPIRRGRVFYTSDRADSEPVAIVSEALADELWPNGDAVGRFLRVAPSRRADPKGEIVRIVGVAGDVRPILGQRATALEVYRPLSQRPSKAVTFFWRSEDLGEATQRLRATARSLDADATLYDVGQLDAATSRTVGRERFVADGVGASAAVAAALAAIGLYGVLAQVVRQRRREFGVRMALGAPRRQLGSRILGYAAVHAIAGVALGTLGGWAVTRLLNTQLPGLETLTLPYWSAIAGIVLAMTLAATFGPARSATTLDPTEALRED